MEGQMKSLRDKLDKAAQDIVRMEEGDLFSIDSVHSDMESVYQDLVKQGDTENAKMVDSLLRQLDEAILGKVDNFAALKRDISDGISAVMMAGSKDQASESLEPNLEQPETEESGEIDQSAFPLTEESEESALSDFPLTEEESVTELSDAPLEREISPEEHSESPSEDTFDLTEDEDLYRNFIGEARDHLENVEKNILELERDPLKQESVQIIFRAFHTIKGVSGFLNLNDLNFLSHQVETYLEYVKDNDILLESESLDSLLDFSDMTKQIIDDTEAKLDGTVDSPPPIDRQQVSATITHLLEISEKRVERKRLGEILMEQEENGITLDEGSLEEALNEQIDHEDEKIGEILIHEKKVDAKQVAHALQKQKETTTITTDAGIGLRDHSTVKVNAVKLDNLLDMVGELVIANYQVSQSSVITESHNEKLQKDMGQLQRVISDLQRESMSLRMVEIKQTFQKISRLVRDLAKKSKKPVHLEIIGEDTEIDRSIVDDIYEPLVHIVRNAMDHGIESPEERLAAGKPKTGKLTLSAYHQGGDVVIEIEDDGQGVNHEKILSKAIERGVIDSKEELTNEEIVQLMFKSGLSTAKELTDISGRGIGMDIVRESIERLRGKVDVFTTKGKGSTISLKIPLTMAIIDGMIIILGDRKYVIPTLHVRHILKLEKDKYFTVEKKGEMVDVRGNLVPLVRLYRLFNVEVKHKDPEDALLILVENEGKQKCFMLDDIVDKQEVVVKSLGQRLSHIEGVSAGTILGDGKVGLILDVKGIFNWQEKQKTQDILEEELKDDLDSIISQDLEGIDENKTGDDDPELDMVEELV
ncbi:MAG: chemotaxis protein CheA [Spirochaetota bacterium]|nr:chemotaxis protein CheA [Spirochaetota bacterium]